MNGKLKLATAEDVPGMVALRVAVAAKLTEQYGQGAWSGVSIEKGVLLDLRTSKVFVMYRESRLVATLRLATKKPWAIDIRYFNACRRPLYLLHGRNAGQTAAGSWPVMVWRKQKKFAVSGRLMVSGSTPMTHRPVWASFMASVAFGRLAMLPIGDARWSILN